VPAALPLPPLGEENGFFKSSTFGILIMLFSWVFFRGQGNRQLMEVTMKVSGRLLHLLRTVGRLWTDLPLLIRLLKAWMDGRYRGLSVQTLVAVVAALLYVISPLDVMPDFIPWIGLFDDAVVLAWLLSSIAKDLDRFRDWERGIIDAVVKG
jgi:uncharacterized membrane protein YkvA (DUF1232 family)